MNVYLHSQRITLDPAAVIGQGGEAEVFDIGGGQALKIFKRPQHPDFDGMPDQQDAARQRIALHQRKLPDFPQGLPERVIAPVALASDRKRGGQLVGYAMRLVGGAELLARHAEPQVRRQLDGNQVVAVLRDLHATVTALHRAGVIIGDFNEHNVLATGQRAYLIDADSFQFGAYPCTVFTERFVDPLLCDAQAAAPVLCRPYTGDSDWYAFHVLVMRTLLCVGPHGGVYRPADPARRIPQAARPLRRVTVFDPEVVYPKPALHYGLLPDALLDHLQAVFCRDRRGALPAALLDDLRFTRCLACGTEHARDLCPACRPGVARQAASARVRGRLRVDELVATTGLIMDARLFGDTLAYLVLESGELRDHTGAVLATGIHMHPGRRIACWPGGAIVADGGHARVLTRGGATVHAPADIAADTCEGHTAIAASGRTRVVWASGGRLLCWRGAVAHASQGPADLGAVLRGQTRLWLGDTLGFGLYRAGALTVGFVFDPERRGLNDRVELPAMRGRVDDIWCAIGSDRVWLFWREHRQGRELARAALIAASGALLATAETHAADPDADTGAWLHAGHGVAAAGPYLFAPTDAGIVRIEANGNTLRATRSFPDTEPVVSASDRLLAGPDGLYVVKPDRILRLTLS
jgi:hypothetical protein